MFRIRFQGLITHAQIEGRRVAVFYNEPGHFVRLAANDGEWIEDETDLKPVGTGDGFKCFDISGPMRLINVETGGVTAQLAGVPHLAKICDGTEPREEIRRRLPHSDFIGYLEIEGGLLSIEDWYTENVTFDGVTLRCLPRTVVLNVGATKPKVVLQLNDDKKITFNEYATVTIRNDDRISPSPNEYQFYKRFFKKATSLQQPLAVTSIHCEYGSTETAPKRCGGPGTLGVECSNNQFP